MRKIAVQVLCAMAACDHTAGAEILQAYNELLQQHTLHVALSRSRSKERGIGPMAAPEALQAFSCLALRHSCLWRGFLTMSLSAARLKLAPELLSAGFMPPAELVRCVAGQPGAA